MTGPSATAPSAARRLSPETERMVARISTITDATVVYEVTLEDGEKPVTVRQQLLRAARIAGIDVAVRRSARGFYGGLMTDARRSKRGRPRPDTSGRPAP